MMNNNITFIVLIALGIFTSCTEGKGEYVKLKIHDLSQTYQDNTQSPINLITNLSLPTQHELEISIDEKINAVRWTGHTVELKISDNSFIKSHNYDHNYEFKQLHFHTPSEHDIDGQEGPMEMHMVSALTNEKTGIVHYLVIGILFKEGKENPFISKMINHLPKELLLHSLSNKDEHAHEQIVDISDDPINLDNLYGSPFKNHLKEFYFYNGSLTTPPYTETVEWYVAKDYVEISKEQIAIMKEIMGDNSRLEQEKFHLDHGFMINI